MIEIATMLAPGGSLRAVINIHNSILAPRSSEADAVRGLPVDLATTLADQLRLPLQLLFVRGAAAAFDLIGQGKADIGFLAVDATRAAKVDFTTPFIQFDATYMAPQGRLSSVVEADVGGQKIAVLRGSGPDLYLGRALAHATLIRLPSPAEALNALLSGDADIMAGNRHALDVMACSHPALAVLGEAFMTIGQAICLPKGRPVALTYATDFVEQMKASGMVANSLHRSGQDPTLVAPLRQK